MKEQTNDGFSISYSAEEQAEVRRIREKYDPEGKKESSLDRLRKLDAGVYKKAGILSITVGIIGTLIMGTGMSLAMTELGASLGIYALALGIPVGIIGIGITVAAYPIYRAVLKRERERIAPEIMLISEELLKDNP